MTTEAVGCPCCAEAVAIEAAVGTTEYVVGRELTLEADALGTATASTAVVEVDVEVTVEARLGKRDVPEERLWICS